MQALLVRIYRSNRAEELARALSAVVRSGARAPLEPEVVVVQSRGMERWLSLTLSSELGVWFGARFPFPRAFVDEVTGHLLGVAGSGAFSRERLTFRVATELAAAAARPELAPVLRYLRHDGTGRDLLALAARLADLFDQYAVYRPDLVLAWERGEDDDWQAHLWRALMAQLRREVGDEAAAALHLAGRWALLRQRLAGPDPLPPGIPRRVSLFGVASLPPTYLELFALLGERVDVHLFLLCPSRERSSFASSAPGLTGDAAPALRPPDADHPLLTALGHVHHDLERVLEALAPRAELAGEPFVDPGTDSLLHAVQHDLLCRRRRGAGGGEDPARTPPLAIPDTDRSIELHACHAPLREVEVLHELLRAAFEDDPTLEPHEVLVMTPRVAAYAPLIDAVFGADDGGGARIPYRVADQAPGDRSPVVRAALTVLSVLAGRVTLGEVAELLDAEPVRARFGLDAGAVPRLLDLCGEAGIRWGIDAADRAACGAPAVEANTWRRGLHRLLLGHALPDAAEPFAGVAPVAAGDPELLGRLAELLTTLFAWRDRLRAPRPVAEHAAALLELLPAWLSSGAAAEEELALLRGVAAALGEAAAAAGFSAPIPLELFRELVAERLPEAGTAAGFLAGGVTFSALLPMRSVPFRVVCLLGMNDGDFPRARPPTSFDRMLAAPRPGDRSVRREDEHLFLEVLLSARERLVISYLGRSMQDDTVRAPSVVVGDLIELLDEAFVVASPSTPAPSGVVDDRGGVGTRRIVSHPIQRFSPRRFAAGAATFDAVAAAGARALTAPRRPPSRLLTAPLPAPAVGELSLDAIVDALASPSRALLRGRLGVSLEERGAELLGQDPIELDARTRRAIGADLLTLALGSPAGAAVEVAWERERARGRLPQGAAGRSLFEGLVPEVEAIAREARRHRLGDRLAPVPVALALGDARLVGVLEELWPGAQVLVRYAREGGGSELDAWVRHLALQVLRGDAPAPELPARTVVVARPREAEGAAVFGFRELDPATARRELEFLLTLVGLAATAPVPFFPRAAREYAAVHQRLAAKGAPDAAERALAAARGVFLGAARQGAPGEARDPYVRRLHADGDPLAPEPDAGAGLAGVAPFPELALRVFGPLLAAREAGDDDPDLAGEART
ncbi:MAG TPA: exodeoxyribonuclease V subunit gamma [Polyangiaceae bacterium]|nr:exodeoxyribonuclease V subunit gamma [Polyangiaceae bacterium]